MTALPPRVFMRVRKPWVLARRTLEGWYVRFIFESFNLQFCILRMSERIRSSLNAAWSYPMKIWLAGYYDKFSVVTQTNPLSTAS